MAPDSRLWRHQLGEATFGFRRHLAKASLPICFFLVMTANAKIEARTEPDRDSWSALSARFLAYERPTLGASDLQPFLSPPSMLTNSSPAGRWSNRIQIHIPNQPLVEKYTRFYHGPGRLTIKSSLDRAWPYIPVMADILESNGVPADLLAVVLVESCFKGRATCRGAGGYWQLLAATARSMGLRVDSWVDERRDPVKSTQAAAKYLRSFYERYHSWPLALAAYNAGSGPVSRALQKGGTSDYWELSRRRFLSARTREYVPKVLAAIRIMRNPEGFTFERQGSSKIHDFESIWLRAQTPLHLEQIARWLGVPVEHMRSLNPSLRQDRLPPEGGFHLNLPSGSRDKFDLAYLNPSRR